MKIPALHSDRTAKFPFAPPVRILSLTLLCAGAATVRAALQASLAAPVQNAAPGTELVFTGTLTNTAAAGKLFLNDISATLPGPSGTALTLDSAAFFSNVPGILLPGESYTGVLFRIALGSTAPAAGYTGTINFSGGAGILDTTVLQSAAFTVLSPAVSITAPDAEAGEYGPDTASLTVSRTGAADIPLPVNWTLTGTAAAAFPTLPAGLTIPAGAASASLTLTPVPDTIAHGDRTLTLTLQSSGSYRLSAPPAATVTLHDKPADAWRLLHFGAAANSPAAADAADWDLDGTGNLLEYALGLDPAAFDSPLLPSAGGLILTYIPDPAAVDVRYIEEASGDLLDWSPTLVEPLAPPPGSPPGTRAFGPAPWTWLDERAFLRLRVER